MPVLLGLCPVHACAPMTLRAARDRRATEKGRRLFQDNPVPGAKLEPGAGPSWAPRLFMPSTLAVGAKHAVLCWGAGGPVVERPGAHASRGPAHCPALLIVCKDGQAGARSGSPSAARN